ncbi:MAG: hypothetical protein DRN81_04080 [Thermoproteota archaeon]|nr:MAG: hypothetical protein DRN81_04080 [Candidatus Korarchaeota archaeon]
MQVKIRISETMEKVSRNEDRVVRCSTSLIKDLSVKYGDMLYLKTTSGDLHILQVLGVFPADDVADCVYVTKNTADKIGVSWCNAIPTDNITVGCDPEAFIVDQYRSIVPAYTFFNKVGSIGSDGPLIEFRPSFSTDPVEVSNNLRSLFSKTIAILNRKNRSTSSTTSLISRSSFELPSGDYLCAGFHIHLGLPAEILMWRKMRKDIAKAIITVFDYYVGVPSILPEGRNDSARRTGRYVRYGKPGEYNIDSRTFEFRLPGGINLRHPTLTTGLLALSTVVAKDIVYRIRACTDDFRYLGEANKYTMYEIYPRLPDISHLYGIICNRDITPALRELPRIYEDVQKMYGYKDHSREVESYFKVIEDFTIYRESINTNWRLIK